MSPEDHWPPGFGRERAAAEALGLEGAAFASFWEGPGRSRYLGRPVAELFLEAAFVQGVTVADAEVAAALAAYGRYHDQALSAPRPDVVRGLGTLRENGLGLALLSNADDREVAAWTGSPLAALIPITGFSYRLGVAKPDPVAYRKVLDLLSLHPASVVFVGDGGGDEFEGARRAGMGRIVSVTGFGVAGGLRPPQQIEAAATLADDVVTSVEELPGLILG